MRKRIQFSPRILFAGLILSTVVASGLNASAADEINPASALQPIPSPQAPTVDVSVLSTDDANALFRSFAQAPNIPYTYRVDGCYARATAMARIAEAKHIELGKVFAEGFLRAKAQAPEAQTPVEWGWHVAPVAYIKDKSGVVKLSVFDPSLANRPVPIEEWKAAITLPGYPESYIQRLYYRPKFDQWPKGFQPIENKDWNPEVLNGTETTLKTYQYYVDNKAILPTLTVPRTSTLVK